MTLYHGTSAQNALDILQSGSIKPSPCGFFYCFSSDKPESMAGALCFATGENLRCGSIDTKNILKHYTTLNPHFPKGLKGKFATMALRSSIQSWKKDQQTRIQGTPFDRCAAIIVFVNHDNAIPVSRMGFVNEVRIPKESFSTLKIERVYIEDTILNTPEIRAFKNKGIQVSPLSHWVAAVELSAKALKDSKNNTKKPPKSSF